MVAHRVGGEPGDLEYARVHLACGRIAGGAGGIAQAHHFGVPEGPHEHPWTEPYHREAVHLYAESLPPSYQCDVGALFSQSADAMDRRQIPARLAGHWAIVAAYLRNASAAIRRPPYRSSTIWMFRLPPCLVEPSCTCCEGWPKVCRSSIWPPSWAIRGARCFEN